MARFHCVIARVVNQRIPTHRIHRLLPGQPPWLLSWATAIYSHATTAFITIYSNIATIYPTTAAFSHTAASINQTAIPLQYLFPPPLLLLPYIHIVQSYRPLYRLLPNPVAQRLPLVPIHTCSHHTIHTCSHHTIIPGVLYLGMLRASFPLPLPPHIPTFLPRRKLLCSCHAPPSIVADHRAG